MARTPKNETVVLADDPESVAEDIKRLHAEMRKEYGDGVVINLADPGARNRLKIERLPTGAPHLDDVLEGGIPRGMFTEVSGPPSSGKSTLMNSIIAQAHRAGLRAALIDTEYTADYDYMEACGVQPPMLDYIQPDTAEQALNMVEKLVRSGRYGLIVLDSIAAMPPAAEVENNIGDATVGLLSRLMAQLSRKAVAPARRTNTAVVLTNQVRADIGGYSRPGMPPPLKRPGGYGLEHLFALRLEVRRGEIVEVNKRPDHVVTRIKVAKSKISSPYDRVEVDIFFGRGISREGGLLSLGVDKGVIQRGGAHYKYNGELIAVGRDAAIEALEKNRALADEIEAAVRAARLPTYQPEESFPG